MTKTEKERLIVLEEKLDHLNENVESLRDACKERLDEHALRIHDLELSHAQGSLWRKIGDRVIWVTVGVLVTSMLV